jgi:lipopolysaccharide/colanic/teichoic acid biosynthesis glycosyltransferase
LLFDRLTDRSYARRRLGDSAMNGATARAPRVIAGGSAAAAGIFAEAGGIFGKAVLENLAGRRAFAERRVFIDDRPQLRGLSRSSRLLKRAFDLLAATVMLILGAPLLVLAALAIRLEGPGPVFFRQTRVGRYDRPFRILKFRTMVVGADELKESLREFNEATGLFKIAADPRVTRVGGLVRRTCIDELPQLLNVLRGEMSLVGPRPLIPEEDCQIRGWHRGRLQTAPGMTGHWQVLGAARVPLQEMVAIDCRYIANWTILSDIKTLVRTVPCVLSLRGM